MYLEILNPKFGYHIYLNNVINNLLIWSIKHLSLYFINQIISITSIP